MTTSGPLTWARLVAIARRVGVKVVEAPSSHRGKIGKMGSVVGPTLHWTGTANSFKPADDYPDFNVVKEGRTGLLNSLSAYGLGRREAIYVFSEELSYHAGVWSYAGITDGNGHFLGIEGAGTGDWTEFQRKVYPRLVAAILLDVGSGPDMAPTHAQGAMPRGRKTDIALPADWYQGKSFRQWVEFFMANPAYINVNYGGDDMANVPQDQWDELVKRVNGLSVAMDWFFVPDNDPKTPGDESQPNSKGEFGKRIRGLADGQAMIIAQQGALLAALNKLSAGGGADAGEIQAAAKAGAQAALAELGTKLQ